MKKAVIAAVVAIGMGMACLYFWPTRPVPAPQTAKEPLESRGVVTLPLSEIKADAIPSPKSLGPLPPVSQPFRTIIAKLKARADQGDAGAACRIAVEFAYCKQLGLQQFQHQRWLEQRQKALTLIQDPVTRQNAIIAMNGEMTFRDERLARYSDHCDGVPPPSTADSIELWRTGAALGSVAAMKQYASGNAFRWDGIMESLPQLQRYQREAEGIAKRAAAAGDFDMMLALASAYAPQPNAQRSLLGQSVKPDGAYSLAIYSFLQSELDASGIDAPAKVTDLVASRLDELRSALNLDEQNRAKSILGTEVSQWRRPDFKFADRSTHRPDSPDEISLASCGDS